MNLAYCWAHKMEYLFELQDDEYDHHYTRAEVEAWVVPEWMAELLPTLNAESMERFQDIQKLFPVNRYK